MSYLKVTLPLLVNLTALPIVHQNATVFISLMAVGIEKPFRKSTISPLFGTDPADFSNALKKFRKMKIAWVKFHFLGFNFGDV